MSSDDAGSTVHGTDTNGRGPAAGLPPALSRADLHVHSTASAVSKLGVQRAVGLPECATPPEEVYELAKRRGMDFVTITDHDTIDGVLQIADRPDVFVGEELTAWFAGEPQAVHVLCLGITPDDHEWLQAHRGDVVRCADYLHDREIACALAHPYFPPEAPLAPRHRQILAEIFPIWETRNGSRARELNQPAAIAVDADGRSGVAGSDDHAGVDVARTFTETPLAYTPAEFLAHIRGGRTVARGEQGSAAKWAHAAIAIAARALGTPADHDRAADAPERPDPLAVADIVSRVLSEGDVRRGGDDEDGPTPDDARTLLGAWLASVGMAGRTSGELVAELQRDDLRHRDLLRRARTSHERRLSDAIDLVLAGAATLATGEEPDVGAVGGALLDAMVPVLPYAPSAAFLGREKRKLDGRPEADEPRRVALVADGIGSMHGVTNALATIRERGVPGYDVEIVGTDGSVDRRVPVVRDVEVPHYAGLEVGVPSVPALVEVLAEGRYDVVHVCAPGPAGLVATAIARCLGLPLVGSYHTELASYAGLRSADARLEEHAAMAVGLFYGQADVVLTPSPQSDAALVAMGVPEDRLGRWDRGVDLDRFGIADAADDATAGHDPARIRVLYSGRLTTEKGCHLLADAFLAARERDPRLHLVLAGGGPEEGVLRERLGEHATFLGWLSGDDLPAAYRDADLFLFASRTDTFGQVLLEAQASGLPVVAVDEGGPRSRVDDGVTGFLRPADAAALAEAVVLLASDPALRRTMGEAGRVAVRSRTWEAAMGRLADGYRRALAAGTLRTARRDAEADAAREAIRPARRRVA